MAQPIITAFNMVAPGDTVTIPARDFGSGHTTKAITWKAERAPLYDTSAQTNPSNGVWCQVGATGGSGTQSSPYPSPAVAIANMGTTARPIICDGAGSFRLGLGTLPAKVTQLVGARGSAVWLDGSKPINTGSWSQAGSVWTWSGSYNPTMTITSPSNEQIFIDGVPLIKTTSSTPAVGQFYTSGTTLKVGYGSNPGSHLVEYGDLAAPCGTISTGGFKLAYLGMRRYGSTWLTMSGTNQFIDHVVLAYGAGTGFMFQPGPSKGLTVTEMVMTHGAGKIWSNDVFSKAQNLHMDGVRIWANNWRLDHNVAPGNSASLGGVKHWKPKGFRGRDMLFGWNCSNGEWFDGSDVGNVSTDNETVRVTYWYNGGYGHTTEVADDRRIADVLAVGNGWLNFGNEDGTRMSGVSNSAYRNVTSLNNVGAAIAIYEDGREFQGSDTNSRNLNGTPTAGDSVGATMRGCVMLRGGPAIMGTAVGQKPPFYSVNGSPGTIVQKTVNGTSYGVEGTSTGYAQSGVLSTKQMFANDANAGTLAWNAANLGSNVYLDLTGTTQIAQWATPTQDPGWLIKHPLASNPNYATWSAIGSPTATTKYTLAALKLLGTNIENGSIADTTAGRSINDYFPDASDPGNAGEPAAQGSSYSWWGRTTIPKNGSAIPTYTLASPGEDWVADALGVAHGATVIAGCRYAPVPQPIGALAFTFTNGAPDTAHVGTPYSFQFTTANGTGADNFTTTSAGTTALSAHGLSLGIAGGLTGAPVGNGTISFPVTATDSSTPVKIVTQIFSLTVTGASVAVTIDTASPLNTPTAGIAFTQTLSASGGTGGPYTWSKTAGTLPTGFTLHSTGVLDGTSSDTTGGDFSFTLQADDGVNTPATKSFTQHVNPTNTPPDIATLTTPSDGDTLTGNAISVSAQCHDPSDGTNVTAEVRADGQPLSTPLFLTHTTGNTFTGTLDSTLLPDGSHDLRVRVTDTQGLWTPSPASTVTVSNGSDTTPPTVGSLTGLTEGDIVSAPTTISVPVTDASGVASVNLVVKDDAGNTYTFAMT